MFRTRKRINGLKEDTMRLYAKIKLLLLVAFCIPQILLAQSKAPLTNDDVIQMVGNGLPENVVIGSISANDVNFDVSPNSLLVLRKANVSDKIVEAMLSAQTKQREAARAAAAAPAALASTPRVGAMGVPIMNSPGADAPVQLPKVMLVVGDQKIPIQPSSTEIANSKGKGGSKAGGILKGFGTGMEMAGSMAGAPMPHGGSGAQKMPGVAYTWALPRRTSSFSLPSHASGFEIEFSDIPGIDPDAYQPVIVRLIQTKDNWRLVETSQDKFDKHGNDTRSTKTKDKLPLMITPLGRGHLQVRPASELTPGEYGLVLHPKKDQKEFAGVPMPNVEALFYSVWDFSVPSTEASSALGPH
jgi:hypothetical protein